MAATKIEASNIAAGAVASTGLSNVVSHTASTTWTKPTDITKVIVEVQAGGGGGGYSGAQDYVIGGSGGGYARKFIDVSSVTKAVITVGAAGTAAGTASEAGGDGGDSRWLDTGFGGSSDVKGVKGVGAYSNLGIAAGGAATGGDINIGGGPGDNASAQAGSNKPGESFLGIAGRNSPTGGIQASSGYGAGGPGGFSVTSLAGMPGIVIVWEFK